MNGCSSFFRAALHSLARDFGERFCSKIKFGKRRNTLCISSFSNCNIGAKDPPKAEDIIVRCCLKETLNKPPAAVQRLFPWIKGGK